VHVFTRICCLQDKQADALREKLCLRLEMATGGPRDWRRLAWCLDQLGYSEKGVKAVMEHTRVYRHTLGDPQVRLGFMV
jgi:condensin complex subunit 1